MQQYQIAIMLLQCGKRLAIKQAGVKIETNRGDIVRAKTIHCFVYSERYDFFVV
jgi:hypothetical protein